MRARGLGGMLALAMGVGAFAAAAAPAPQQVLAGAPTDLAVTVYRSSGRDSGAMDLDELQGFALIRETRVVRLPAGLSRVRFEGVTDGIEPVSAIVTGLHNGVLEKNLDADLLSPATLVAAAAGRRVMLVRSNAVTGKTERVAATILSGAEADGVVFQAADGIQALRCSGLPETFSFTTVNGLSATPTLSVLVRTTQAVTEHIQLSYLAYGFDWSANYSAVLAEDGRTVDLGAWVTLANGNATSFAAARTQVVAGRLNRESDGREPIESGGPVLARCWPHGSTSDPADAVQIERAIPLGFAASLMARMRTVDAAAPMAELQEVTVTGAHATQEQLGDLKLYRVPERTTVTSHQSKQVRLLDRAAIPVHLAYTMELSQEQGVESFDTHWQPAQVLLRSRNDAAHHLGLPLPSGQVAVFGSAQGSRLLLKEAPMRDLAVNEEVEIDMGRSSAVQVRSIPTNTDIDPARNRTIPIVPGSLSLRISEVDVARQVEVSNARNLPIDFEVLLQLDGSSQVIRADHPMATKNGHPVFRFKVPAHDTAQLRFQTAHAVTHITRP